MLDGTSYAVQVSNYGMVGYVSTQEMILLLEQLQKGNVPDLVVFYDGYNDMGSALINHRAGETYGELSRRLEFNAFNQWSSDHLSLYKQALTLFVLNSGLGRLAEKLSSVTGRYGGKMGQEADPGHGDDWREMEALQEQVVRTYLANKALVEAVGRSFGFRCLFFWQPSIWTKSRHTPYEDRETGMPGEGNFMRGVNRRIESIASETSIYDLSGVFGDSAEPYYIDEVHITGEGNRIVAQAMLSRILAALKAITDDRAERSSASARFPAAALGIYNGPTNTRLGEALAR
jgi:hypothetical protein